MNAFYKVKVDYWGEGSKEGRCGVVVGNDESDIMSKTMHYYGRENVEQITFWFGENFEEDVIEFEDFKDCSLFDLKSEL